MSSTVQRPRCFECGDDAQHEHHVVPRSIGGTATVSLCADCHCRAHGGRVGHWTTPDLTRAAMQRKKERGELAGAAPLGYRATVDGFLERDERELETILTAKKLRNDGASMRAIARALSDAGHRSRAGRPYQLTQVARMLRWEPRVSRGEVAR